MSGGRSLPPMVLAGVLVLTCAFPSAARGQRRAGGAEDEASLLVGEAREALAARHYRRAGKLLDQALAINPRRVHVYVLRASAHSALDEHDLAIALLARATVLAPDNLDVQSALGVQLVLGKRTRAGVALLEKVVARDRARYDAQAALGRHYVGRRHWRQAIAAFEAYFQARPLALANRDAAHRLSYARARLRAGEPGRARRQYRAVLRAEANNRVARLGLLWSTAAIDCRAVPALVGSMADLLREYPAAGLVAGQCALARGRYPQARSRAAEYRRRVPKDPRGWSLLGELERRRGDLPSAFTAFARAFALAPTEPRWAFELARVERLQGEAAKAAARLRRAGPPAGLRREWTLELSLAVLADGRPGVARALLTPHVDAYGGDMRARRLLGTALVALAHHDEAIAQLEPIVAHAGPEGRAAAAPLAAALEARARRALAQHGAQRAQSDLVRAIALVSTRERVLLLAAAQIVNGAYAPAAAALETLRQRPTVQVLSLLAQAYRGAGRNADAAQVLTEALALPARSQAQAIATRVALASALVADDRAGLAVRTLEPLLPAKGAQAARVMAAYVVAGRAQATGLLGQGAYWRAYRVLLAVEKKLPTGHQQLVAVQCDLALAATGAGQREQAIRRLQALSSASCPFAAPADKLAVPILLAWNRGLELSHARSALAKIGRLRKAAGGTAGPLLRAAHRDLALRAAAEAHGSGSMAVARRYLAKALELGKAGPHAPIVEHNRAVLLLESSKLDDAIAILQRVAADIGEAHVNLGLAYERKGDYKRALSHYRRALAAGVAHKPLARWIASIRRVWGLR